MALDVLIVDDEADIRELVAGVLEDEGYETRTAAGSEGAESKGAAKEPVKAFALKLLADKYGIEEADFLSEVAGVSVACIRLGCGRG